MMFTNDPIELMLDADSAITVSNVLQGVRKLERGGEKPRAKIRSCFLEFLVRTRRNH